LPVFTEIFSSNIKHLHADTESTMAVAPTQTSSPIRQVTAAPAAPSVTQVCTPAHPHGDHFTRVRQASLQPPAPAHQGGFLGLHISMPEIPKIPPKPTHLSAAAQAMITDLDKGQIKSVEQLEHRMSALSNGDVYDVAVTAWYNRWIGLRDALAMNGRSNTVRAQCIAAGGNPDSAAIQRALAPIFMNDPSMHRVAQDILKNAAA
jgi:hypothetical protein